MVKAKTKGYRSERKVRRLFERHGFIVVRAGASLGEADLVCFKKGRCVLLQIKSSRKKTFYYYGTKKRKIEGFPFFLVVDFGYGRIRVMRPRLKVNMKSGLSLEEFLHKF